MHAGDSGTVANRALGIDVVAFAVERAGHAERPPNGQFASRSLR